MTPSDAKQKPPKAARVMLGASAVVAVLSLSALGWALFAFGRFSERWYLHVVVFAFVIAVPQFLVDWFAIAAESVEGKLTNATETRGFENLGAWVGFVERPLLLASLIGGYPEFIAGWYVLKGVGGYSLGLDQKPLKERRQLQLFLVNNGMSFLGVALGYLAWRVLGLPTF